MSGRRAKTPTWRLITSFTAIAVAAAGCSSAADPDEDDRNETGTQSQGGQVIVADVSDSDKDAICEAIQAGVEEYAGSVDDVNEEVLDDRNEHCYFARGNDDMQNVAMGMTRVYEFDDSDIETYESALDEDGSDPTQCAVYFSVVKDKDDQFGTGVSQFSDVDDAQRPYCSGEDGGDAVLSFTIPGAAVVLEFSASGELNDEPADALALRDEVLPDVFAAAPE